MNALNSSLVLDSTQFNSTNVTLNNSTTSEEDCWWFRIFFDYIVTTGMFVLIPSKYVLDVLMFKRVFSGYTTSKILVVLMMALIFYLYNADDLIPPLICIMCTGACAYIMLYNDEEYNVASPLDIFDAFWEENDVDEQNELDEDYEIDFGKLFHFLSAVLLVFWLMLSSNPLTWFKPDRSWNFWKGIFADGMEWQLFGQLLLLTYHALDAIQKGLYGKIVCKTSKSLMPMAAIFLAVLFDDQIWNLEDADEREKMARVYLFIYLSLFTIATHHILKLAFTQPHFEDDIREKEQFNASGAQVRLALGSIFCCYYGNELLESFTPHSSIFMFNGCFVVAALFIDFKTWLHRFVPFSINRRTIKLLSFLNTIALKLEFLVVIMWMCVYQHVTYLRVGTMVVVAGFILKDIWTFLQKKILAWMCVWFLPRATAQQLALNDNVCLMCHEELESACITPCKHFYHAECLLSWLYRHRRCPLCRRVLYANSPKCYMRMFKKVLAAVLPILIVAVLVAVPLLVMFLMCTQ